MRRICYLTGTRADYGLMRRTLFRIAETEGLAIDLAVTGMHLRPEFGLTLQEIERDDFAIRARIESLGSNDSGAEMARAIAATLTGMIDAFEVDRPDLLLLLGDRGEMLAGALAAVHMNIPIAHLHGGERSGTVDEPVRHAISKLAHIHLVATEGARARLLAMGERADRVFTVGAPGLVGLDQQPRPEARALAQEVGFTDRRPLALFLYHPVLQHSEASGREASSILGALVARGVQTLALQPNADAGQLAVRAALDEFAGHELVRHVTHLPRDRFIAWMAAADLLIGNSSAGIIEAATFGTPVVNVGDRQAMRERNRNVIDVGYEADAIAGAIDRALQEGRFEPSNIYGDGQSDVRIAELLRSISLDPDLLAKCNAY